MFISKKSLVVIFLAFVTLASSYGQKRRKNRFDILEGTKFTPMVGFNAFYGDLVDESRASYTFGFSLEREMMPYLSARLSANYGAMRGEQIQSDTVVFASFKNSYIDATVGATFRPLDLALGYFKQRSFNPYVVWQIGINYYDALENYNIPAQGTDKFLLRPAKGVTPFTSFGGGVNYWFSPLMSLRLEVLANKPFSDLLDAHEYWPNQDTGELNYTEGQDFYYTVMGGVAFTIKDSRWKNQPKYNRKAYLKTKKYSMFKSSAKKSKNSRPKR